MHKMLPKFNRSYHYVVDKTLLIKEFLDNDDKVSLITRANGFGKTSNLMMMAQFFDINKDSSKQFKVSKIIEINYGSYMNKYPTIMISFANAKGNKQEVIRSIKETIIDLYSQYNFLIDDLNQLDLSDDSTLQDIWLALPYLMEQMEDYYHQKVMLFIDDYDVPFIEAHINGFYQDIKEDLLVLLTNALKNTSSLKKAMLTGVFKIKDIDRFETKVYTIEDKGYDEYFGFSKQESESLLTYYGLELSDEVTKMYGGYHIGEVDLYNPYSIMNYAINKELKIFNNISVNILDAIKTSDEDFKWEFEKLLLDKALTTYIEVNICYYDEPSTYSLWGLLANNGYISITNRIWDDSFHNYWYELKIANKEAHSALVEMSKVIQSLD